MSKQRNSNKVVIPEPKERAVADRRADILTAVKRILGQLTPALCETVFEKYRDTERERKWTFYSVIAFWTAMIIRHPKAIEHGLSETRKGRGRNKLWPYVMATARAFYKKATRLRPHLFEALYEAFIEKAVVEAPVAYASWLMPLKERFSELFIIDGSRLDAICHRLKILWPIRSKILPGCVTVFYDLFRGVARKVLYFPDAAEAELPRSRNVLAQLKKGTLLLGDRLYASIEYFHLLSSLNLSGLFRRNKRIKLRWLRELSMVTGSRTLLEDVLVEAGCGQRCPTVTLRLIRYKHEGKTLEILTNVLDVNLLSATEAVALYTQRWTIERMFLDVKETLSLHTLYASHPNLVAQQVYATALVHAAFRIAQAQIAEKAKILPEQLSPAKLFPRLAEAIVDYCNGWLTLKAVRDMNRGRKLKLPDLHLLPSAYSKIRSLLVRRRNGLRKKRRFCTSRKRWKSFAHVPGGPSLLKKVSVH